MNNIELKLIINHFEDFFHIAANNCYATFSIIIQCGSKEYWRKNIRFQSF